MIRTEYRVTVGCDEALCFERIVISTTHELKRPVLLDEVKAQGWQASERPGARIYCAKHTRGKGKK